jgi:hypothetical protein
MVYFAYGLKIKMDDLEVVNIEKYPKIRERYDPKGKGKYFLVTKDHYSLMDVESEGSIQEIINQISLEKKNEVYPNIGDSIGICYYATSDSTSFIAK